MVSRNKCNRWTAKRLSKLFYPQSPSHIQICPQWSQLSRLMSGIVKSPTAVTASVDPSTGLWPWAKCPGLLLLYGEHSTRRSFVMMAKQRFLNDSYPRAICRASLPRTGFCLCKITTSPGYQNPTHLLHITAPGSFPARKNECVSGQALEDKGKNVEGLARFSDSPLVSGLGVERDQRFWGERSNAPNISSGI